MFRKAGIVIIIFFMFFMIPMTVAGAIVSNPVGFIGDIIFGEGDTNEVTSEIDEMYHQFIKSEIGSITLDYISEKNTGKDRVYPNAYYVIPILITLENDDPELTFEESGISDMLDILFDIRYKYEDDNDYIREIKRTPSFNILNRLSDTTIMMYINHFNGSDSGDIEVSGDSKLGNAIAKSALGKLGCRYVWGASGPNEFDCSGLVYWACKQNGVNFTRTTAAVLSTMGKGLTKEQLQAGDIITFKTDPSYVSHVGIYIGDGKMVHAPNSRSVVRIDNVFGSKYWVSRIHNYRRLY